MPLDQKSKDDEPVPVGDIITPNMRKAGVAAWMACPTKHVETRCVAIFIAMMQAYQDDDGEV